MLVTIGSMLGGLGLFLLAVKMITDGLKLAAGNNLRGMLGQWTSTPARGVLAGSGITAVVQSSSAVTVATIGFVNAGLLDLYQALGVVYGANVGTTVTGWLVAAVGFKIKVEAFALPMIGIGMLLRLTGQHDRRGALGEALAGFGLFFIGIDILRGAFESVAASVQIPATASQGLLGILMFVGIGFLMTVLTQSSSAAIALILTAATGGVLTLSGAAAMVIGANVGTTSTAALAVIGATPNAKRVAAAHIVFNLATGLVALLLLPLMLWVVAVTGKALGLEDIPAVTLALFHTLFNLLGVLLLWPVTGILARYLAQRFRTIEEIEGSPKYLDKTVLVSPYLAVDAATLELTRSYEIVRRMALSAMSTELAEGRRIRRDHATLERLVAETGKFITLLERGSMTREIADALPIILRINQYFTQTADLAQSVASQQLELQPVTDLTAENLLNQYKARVAEILNSTDISEPAYSRSMSEALLEEAEAIYQQLKSALLQSGVRQAIELDNMANTLEQLSTIRRMIKQYLKGAIALHGLRVRILAVSPQRKEINQSAGDTSADTTQRD